ncbi:MAG: TolC family protein, partial [Acidobacteria bacterium]|nr:TolC family protein [Acidobacteriota bacterium]
MRRVATIRGGGAVARALAVALALAPAPAAALFLAPPPAATPAAERRLTLDEAVRLALEKNEAIVIERESLASAEAAVTGAKGAYDPLLELRGDWERATRPVNSAFSGAPQGKASPTTEATGAGASVRQLLPTGGAVTVSATAARQTTDGSFTLLSPAYGTQVGVEVRQPLWRDRATDAARSTLKIAASDRRRAAASLRSEVSDTVAAVERAYWTLVAARRDVAVRDESVRLAAEQLRE